MSTTDRNKPFLIGAFIGACIAVGLTMLIVPGKEINVTVEPTVVYESEEIEQATGNFIESVGEWSNAYNATEISKAVQTHVNESIDALRPEMLTQIAITTEYKKDEVLRELKRPTSTPTLSPYYGGVNVTPTPTVNDCFYIAGAGCVE